MLTPEMFEAAMQERMRQAAELQRQREGEAIQQQDQPPRGSLPGVRFGRLPLPAFVARLFRTASVP